MDKLQVNDVCNIKRNLYNARRKSFSPLHTSADEVQLVLDQHGVQTNWDELFLLVNNKEDKLVIFSCIFNLKSHSL